MKVIHSPTVAELERDFTVRKHLSSLRVYFTDKPRSHRVTSEG